jgi:transcriptional regulator with XRE-family HTH domain
MIENLGTRLRESRQRSKLTQERAGSLAGIKGQTLSLYENGNALPSLEVFYKLVGNYKVSADYHSSFIAHLWTPRPEVKGWWQAPGGYGTAAPIRTLT